MLMRTLLIPALLALVLLLGACADDDAPATTPPATTSPDAPQDDSAPVGTVSLVCAEMRTSAGSCSTSASTTSQPTSQGGVTVLPQGPDIVVGQQQWVAISIEVTGAPVTVGIVAGYSGVCHPPYIGRDYSMHFIQIGPGSWTFQPGLHDLGFSTNCPLGAPGYYYVYSEQAAVHGYWSNTTGPEQLRDEWHPGMTDDLLVAVQMPFTRLAP
jgi:hypothetical protein